MEWRKLVTRRKVTRIRKTELKLFRSAHSLECQDMECDSYQANIPIAPVTPDTYQAANLLAIRIEAERSRAQGIDRWRRWLDRPR